MRMASLAQPSCAPTERRLEGRRTPAFQFLRAAEHRLLRIDVRVAMWGARILPGNVLPGVPRRGVVA